MLQNNMADRGRASKDAWFGGWLPVCAFRCGHSRWPLLASFLAVSLAFAVQRWERGYGDYQYGGASAWSVNRAKESCYFVAGTKQTGPDRITQSWLLKADSCGDTIWTRLFGTPSAYGKAVLATADGGAIICGHVYTTAYPSAFWAFAVRTDSLGDSLWGWTSVADSLARIPRHIEAASDGGVVMAGQMASPSGANSRVMLVKLDGQGQTAWVKTYGPGRAICVKETRDRGFVIVGEEYEGETPGLILRTDSLGDTLWSRRYGIRTLFNSVVLLPSGEMVVAGDACGLQTFAHQWLVHADSLGETLWTRSYGGAGQDGVSTVLVTEDGGFLLAGLTSSYGAGGNDACLVKTDGLGNLEWRRTFGGDDEDWFNAACLTDDGGFCAVGMTRVFHPSYYGEAYIVKTDAYGSSSVEQNEPLVRSPNPPQVTVLRATGGRARSARYYVPESGHVILDVIDALGCREAAPVARRLRSGWYETCLPDELPPGVHFIRLQCGSQRTSVKLVLLSQ